MDERTRRVWRDAQRDPEDSNLQEHLRHLVGRICSPPTERFEGDLMEGGPLDRALRWEQEFHTVVATPSSQGGKIVCNNRYKTRLLVLWVFYPSMDDVLKDLTPGDVRIALRGRTDVVTDVIDTLEGYFGGATIVSAQVAGLQAAQGASWRDEVPKPKRSEEMDRRVLAAAVAAEGSGRGGNVAGRNRWVG
jgi:hypothetical protein